MFIIPQFWIVRSTLHLYPFKWITIYENAPLYGFQKIT